MKPFEKPSRNMQLLGQYLKSLRLDFGLSMHEIARRTSLTPSYISKIESGAVFQSITVQTLQEFAKAYNLPVQLILERAGFIEESADGLPALGAYLKSKHRAPHQAVQEMELAWEIIKKKYLLDRTQ
ncbi:MAG: helix-turn-helix transcriptional regulator [Candidatus Spechtbacteria bacterium]|nr:helix-turn-helix transcriptional regulator [Candidatus Spechtbacteria bacterium]